MAQDLNIKHKVVVFDLDGTLIDSAPDIASAVNCVMKDLGREPLTVDYVERFIGDGSRSMLERIFKEQALVLDEAELKTRLGDYMRYYANDPANKTQFFNHVREDLEALHAADVKLGVCTNKPHALTGLVLEKLGIEQFFSSAIGADAACVKRRKPDADHLLAVLKDMREMPENAIYVGDTEVDRKTAHNAGIPFFLVNWGGGRFINADADTRIERLIDLLPFALRAGSKVDVA